jgi:hypothetical protein
MSRFQIQSDDNWRPMTVTTDDLVKRCADYYQGLVAKGHICIYLFFGKYEGGEGFEVINPEQAGWLDEVRTLLDTGWLPGGFMSHEKHPTENSGEDDLHRWPNIVDERQRFEQQRILDAGEASATGGNEEWMAYHWGGWCRFGPITDPTKGT